MSQCFLTIAMWTKGLKVYRGSTRAGLPAHGSAASWHGPSRSLSEALDERLRQLGFCVQVTRLIEFCPSHRKQGVRGGVTPGGNTGVRPPQNVPQVETNVSDPRKVSRSMNFLLALRATAYICYLSTPLPATHPTPGRLQRGRPWWVGGGGGRSRRGS